MNRNRLLLLFLAVGGGVAFGGPYAPAAGETGSAAIDMNDPNFVGWATGAVVQRGYKKIDEPGLGYVSYGSSADALGGADGDSYGVVSLGDGGMATLTFANPITDGAGYDFAVFENAFASNFLELAFVEVSSDGVNFFRFDAVSLTPTNAQVGGFGTLDATDVHNLAGKYRQGFGTGFDLQELAEVSDFLDVNSVTHVRVIDVVGYVEPADFYGDGIVNLRDYSILAEAYGSITGDAGWNINCDISEPPDGVIDMKDLARCVDCLLVENDYSSCDSQGHQINEPWPTAYETGGFDLDAVGVIHEE